MIPPGPPAPLVFHLPKPPTGDSAAARQVARALRSTAASVEAAQHDGHRVLADAYSSWTGTAATASRHPLALLDLRTVQVARALREAADRLDDYAHLLDKAHEQHHWSWKKVLLVAAVVVVTTTAVVVTVGAATPAAAAADAALVGSEVAATTAAVGTASAAAVEAAEAVSIAVRALQALRAVATFLRPQIVMTAFQTDLSAYRQVRDTGHLDLGTLSRSAGVDLASGAVGARLAGVWGTFGEDALNPVAAWLLPKLGETAAWTATDAATQVLVDGELDLQALGLTGAFAFTGAIAGDLHPTRHSVQSETHGPRPPVSVPRKVDDLLEWLDTHNGTPPRGYKGGKPYKNNREPFLPPGDYVEYDVNVRVRGSDRDAERVVVERTSGRVYYTDSHYLGGYRRVR